MRDGTRVCLGACGRSRHAYGTTWVVDMKQDAQCSYDIFMYLDVLCVAMQSVVSIYVCVCVCVYVYMRNNMIEMISTIANTKLGPEAELSPGP